MRTGLPGQLAHCAAYAGAVSIAVAGYGCDDVHCVSLGYFGYTLAALSTSRTFRRAGIRRLRILPSRRSGRWSVGSPRSFSRASCNDAQPDIA